MNKSLVAITTFARISVKRYFRDRVAIFFTVIFPLIFLFVFGGIFGKNNDMSFNVALINQSKSDFAQTYVNDLKKEKFYKINAGIKTIEQSKDKMGRSELDATILLPPDFGSQSNGRPQGTIQVLYDQNSDQAAKTLTTILQGGLERYNNQFVNVKPPLTAVAKPTNQQGLSRFDYTFAGLLGFSILGLGVFGPTNYFPQMKKQGILRRLHITPLRPWEFFTASAISNALIGLFSIAIMFIVAFTVFDFRMTGNYLALAAVVSLGIISIFGIGLAIGGWAKNENQAAPLANIITFPMMFLSGTFFPRFLMPEWLQGVTTFLPLTPVIDAIRLVATEGKGLTQIGTQIGLMLFWTVVIYAIAFRVFRWE